MTKEAWRVVGVVIGLALVLFVGWMLIDPKVATKSSEDGGRTTSGVLRVGYSPYLLNLPLFVALDNRLFGDIEIDARPFATTNDLTTAVMRGDIDLASATGTELFLRSSELNPGSMRPILFNAFSRERWSEAFLVPASSEWSGEALAHLNGARIGTIPASTAVAYVEYIGETQGIQFQSVNRIAPDQALAALAQGRLDALFAVEPQVAFAIDSGVGKVLVGGPLGLYVHDPLLAGAHVISADLLSTRPQVATRVYAGLVEAVALIQANPDLALDSAERFTGLDRRVLSKARLPLWVPACGVVEEDLAFISNLFFSAEIIATEESFFEYIYCPHD